METNIKLQPAACVYYPNKRGFDLLEDFVFVAADGKKYSAPRCYWYDGASIPAFFWQITYSPFDPIVLPAAASHDWMFTSKIVSREVANETLEKLLLENGASKIKTGMIVKAVDTFSARYWEDTHQDRLYVEALKQRIRQFGGDPHAYGL